MSDTYISTTFTDRLLNITIMGHGRGGETNCKVEIFKVGISSQVKE